MIRPLQPGYKGGVGELHSHSDDKPKIRYCQRCSFLFGVHARLGPRIRMMGLDGKIEPAQPGDDQYVTCRNCGSTYPKHETRIEAEIRPIKEPMTGPKGKVQAVEKKPKQWISRGNNPRSKNSKWEIKDSELKSGAVLLAYSSSDPTEPAV